MYFLWFQNAATTTALGVGFLKNSVKLKKQKERITANTNSIKETCNRVSKQIKLWLLVEDVNKHALLLMITDDSDPIFIQGIHTQNLGEQWPY